MYEFNQNPDQIGLPTESRFYIKNNCKKCYGKGYLIYLIKDGFFFDKETKVKKVNENRACSPCPCINVGYVRTRKMLENQAFDLHIKTSIEVKEALNLTVQAFIDSNLHLF